MASLQVVGLTKRFGARQALRDVTFDVHDHQFVVILGPSGAGKTTTLKVIAGVEGSDSGDIRVGGRSVVGVAPEHRNTALVFENYALYPNMTVLGNLTFPLRARVRSRGLGRVEIKDRAVRVARVLGIEGLLGRRTWQLSGGQRQRVGLGRALVREPNIFLMDEPIAHLDAKLRFEMRAEIKRLQRDLGITTLYATPDYAQAMALADVIVVLREGRVAQIGSPESLFKRPATTYVAHLLGEPHMNMFEMELGSEANGSWVVQRAGLRFGLTLSQARMLEQRATRRVTVGVRPTDVQVSMAEQGESKELHVAAVGVEPRGSSTVVVFAADEQEIVANVTDQLRIEVGSKAWLSMPPESLYFFDVDSGKGLDVPSQECERTGALG